MVDAGVPLVVEVTRGSEVESVHLIDAVVVGDDGSVVDGWGDATRSVLPRSALKPIQAIPLIDTGAADRFELGDVELAMACASHDGEPAHSTTIENWLERIGLSEDTLECGAHRPFHEPSADQLVRAGDEPGPRHNNCSGKHLGFLTVCAQLDYPTTGYVRPDHRLHHDHVTPIVEEICSVDLRGQTPGVDGCGIPVWSIPLDAMARGWSRLPDRPAGKRLLDAMGAEPFFVAGSERACTRLIRATEPTALVKTGAEGVYCGVLPDQRLAVALKTRDGGRRAAEAAIRWILARLGVLELGSTTVVTNWAGTEVGEIRVVG